MFASTIITTIGRATLARSVESCLSQQVSPADFEIIVVNDSGRPLPLAHWQRSERVTILNTNRRERCVARNAGAAIARGTYLHFLDDDDWMLPGAMEELWAVARRSNAAWIYGTARFVDKNETLLTEHHIGVDGNAFVQVVAGEWLPLQASLIRADRFFEAGGFDPRLTVCEDKDICRWVALRGDFANTSAPVACIVRDRERSTTVYDRAYGYSVWSRDNVLSERGAFARMWGAANTPYWHGRLVRAYLTCVAWNLRQRRFIRASTRGVGAAVAFVRSARDVVSPIYWRALIQSHGRKNVF